MSDESQEVGDSSSPTKSRPSLQRKEQIKRAQRTHRERKAKYLQGLESEVKYLRKMNAQVTARLRRHELMVHKLQELLVVNSISIPAGFEEETCQSAGLDIEFVDATQGQRQASTDSGLSLDTLPSRFNSRVDFSDPTTAIAFILALERTCLDHLASYRGEDHEEGHLLQLQTSLLDLNQAIVWSEANTASLSMIPSISKAQLQVQLDRLLATAELLDLEGELTPVMCWNRLAQLLPQSPMTHEQLDFMQSKLIASFGCRGFGAVVDEDVFYIVLDEALSSPL